MTSVTESAANPSAFLASGASKFPLPAGSGWEEAPGSLVGQAPYELQKVMVPISSAMEERT